MPPLLARCLTDARQSGQVPLTPRLVSAAQPHHSDHVRGCARYKYRMTVEPGGLAGDGIIRLGLIDNDRMLLETTAGWFAANAPGMRIEHKASTVTEYLALDPADDLVLLDLRLDDGTRFVDNISRLVRHGPAVLLLSAHASRDVKLDAIRAGAVDYHAKGDLDSLVRAVADIAANRYVLGQELAFAISRDRRRPPHPHRPRHRHPQPRLPVGHWAMDQAFSRQHGCYGKPWTLPDRWEHDVASFEEYFETPRVPVPAQIRDVVRWIRAPIRVISIRVAG